MAKGGNVVDPQQPEAVFDVTASVWSGNQGVGASPKASELKNHAV